MTKEDTRKIEETADYVLIGSRQEGSPDNLKFLTDKVGSREYTQHFLRGCDHRGVNRQGRFPETVSDVIFGKEKPGKHSGWTERDTYDMPVRKYRSLGFPDRIRVQESVRVLE